MLLQKKNNNNKKDNIFDLLLQLHTLSLEEIILCGGSAIARQEKI